MAARRHSEPHLRVFLDILLSPVIDRTFYARATDFSENKHGEKLLEDFKTLVYNEVALTHINSLLLKCPYALTIKEIEMNGGEALIYLSSLRRLLTSTNHRSAYKYYISLIKKISIGQYKRTELLD